MASPAAFALPPPCANADRPLNAKQTVRQTTQTRENVNAEGPHDSFLKLALVDIFVAMPKKKKEQNATRQFYGGQHYQSAEFANLHGIFRSISNECGSGAKKSLGNLSVEYDDLSSQTIYPLLFHGS